MCWRDCAICNPPPPAPDSFEFRAGTPLATTMYNAFPNGVPMVEQTRTITADELFRMRDDGYRYEPVAGRLRKMTPAGSLQGVLASRLEEAMSVHCDQHRLGTRLAA